MSFPAQHRVVVGAAGEAVVEEGPLGCCQRDRSWGGHGGRVTPKMTQLNPFRYFRTSPKIIRLAVMMYVRFPLSLRNVEDLLHERGVKVADQGTGRAI